MTSNPKKLNAPNSDKRDTLQIYQQQVQDQPQNLHDSDKENIYLDSKQKKKRRNSQVFSPLTNQKKPIEYIELHSQTGPDSVKFPVFEDKEIGIQKKYQNELCNPYDMDDDIQTKDSCQDYFIQVCLDDLEEAIQMNKTNQQRWMRLKKYYENLENKII